MASRCFARGSHGAIVRDLEEGGGGAELSARSVGGLRERGGGAPWAAEATDAFGKGLVCGLLGLPPRLGGKGRGFNTSKIYQCNIHAYTDTSSGDRD